MKSLYSFFACCSGMYVWHVINNFNDDDERLTFSTVTDNKELCENV